MKMCGIRRNSSKVRTVLLYDDRKGRTEEKFHDFEYSPRRHENVIVTVFVKQKEHSMVGDGISKFSKKMVCCTDDLGANNIICSKI